MKEPNSFQKSNSTFYYKFLQYTILVLIVYFSAQFFINKSNITDWYIDHVPKERDNINSRLDKYVGRLKKIL